MGQRSLFREEVLAKKINTQYGAVCINLPSQYSLIVTFLTILIILFFCFITQAKIAQKYIVRGCIKYDQYTSNIYPLKTDLPLNTDLPIKHTTKPSEIKPECSLPIIVAEIYVPIEESGCLNIGDKILINYDAYSHARSGSYKGTIKQISKTILAEKEEIKATRNGGPYYKVIASLEQTTLNAYGNKRQIQPGMTFSAVIKGPKKTILSWVLEPLFSFYEKSP